jgi:ADP-ribose pyrophosphatase YjhB (NUDIX family)
LKVERGKLFDRGWCGPSDDVEILLIRDHPRGDETRMNKAFQLFEPTFRSALHLYWRLVRGMTLGVRGLVHDDDQRVLLVMHTYTPGWHLPGGGVEPGETIVEALTRELSEEGNIEIVKPPELFGVYANSRVSTRDHIALFIVRSFDQTQAPVPNMEIAAHRFFPAGALPGDTTPGTRARIAEAMFGSPRSDRW